MPHRCTLLRVLPGAAASIKGLSGAIALAGALVATAAHGADCDPRYASSPQFVAAECKFQNAPNPHARPTRNAWDIWSRFVIAKKEGTVPIDPVPVRTVSRAGLDALDPAANHVIRLGHSSHLLKLRNRYWLIDPVFGERASPLTFAGPKRFHPTPLALSELPPVEGLILSHDHYDHLDQFTIEGLMGKVNRYFVPLGVGARLRQMGVAPERIEEFDWWQEGRFGDVQLAAVPAHHFSGRTLADRDSTLWAGWVIRSGKDRIFFSGDSGYFPGFGEIGRRLGPFDIALMENGAYDSYWPSSHMSPEETVKAFRELNARMLYLVHNSTFDLAFHGWKEPMDRVADIAEKEGLPLATPEVGEVLTLGKPRENKRWWKDLR